MQILLEGEAPYIPRFMQINNQAIFETNSTTGEAGFFQLAFDHRGSWKPPEPKICCEEIGEKLVHFQSFQPVTDIWRYCLHLRKALTYRKQRGNLILAFVEYIKVRFELSRSSKAR